MNHEQFIKELGSIFGFTGIGTDELSVEHAERAIINEVKALAAATDLEELRRMRCRTGAMTAEEGSKKCKSVLVPIPEFIFRSGGIYEFDPSHPEYGINEKGERCLSLDEHIVSAIQALWDAGIVTRSCCCGHGSGWGLVSILPVCGKPS